MVVGKPAQSLARFRRIAIDFGAIAGGNDRGFLDRVAVDQVAQRLHQIFGVKNHLLAQRERSCLVVDAEGEKLHDCQVTE